MRTPELRCSLMRHCPQKSHLSLRSLNNFQTTKQGGQMWKSTVQREGEKQIAILMLMISSRMQEAANNTAEWHMDYDNFLVWDTTIEKNRERQGGWGYHSQQQNSHNQAIVTTANGQHASFGRGKAREQFLEWLPVRGPGKERPAAGWLGSQPACWEINTQSGF